MEDKLKTVKSILKKYDQEHLLNFYGELTDSQKTFLLNQILNIDFEEILQLYEESKVEIYRSTEEIEPLKYVDKQALPSYKAKQYCNTGIKAIKSGNIGVITLAGGQGSRLGFNGPKGSFTLDTSPKKSLFEIVCDYIRLASLKYNVSIPWYIMTSTNNYFDTIDFF